MHDIINSGPYSCEEINVETQRRDQGSLLNWMNQMIRLRKECPEIGWGDWEIIKVESPHVLGMCYEWRGNSLIVLHNFDEKPYEVKLKLKEEGGGRLINLLENNQSEAR